MGSVDPVVILGANGHLGRKLITRLHGTRPLRAVVRSERAAALVRDLNLPDGLDVLVADYRDEAAMMEVMAGADCAVHLVGIIKETRHNTYRDAHEATCEVLTRVAERVGLSRVVYLSILGSRSASDNACLASKGRAETILLNAPTPAVILQVPMVLGEGDYATRALMSRARKTLNVLLRAASIEQPIFAGDVVDAITAGLFKPGLIDQRIRLAGPEALTQGELTRRAAGVFDNQTRILSLPVAVGYVMAYLMENLLAHPPITRAMLGVLDHDDNIDPAPGAQVLGIKLTSLEETLMYCLKPDQFPEK